MAQGGRSLEGHPGFRLTTPQKPWSQEDRRQLHGGEKPDLGGCVRAWRAPRGGSVSVDTSVFQSASPGALGFFSNEIHCYYISVEIAPVFIGAIQTPKGGLEATAPLPSVALAATAPAVCLPGGVAIAAADAPLRTEQTVLLESFPCWHGGPYSFHEFC